jgi:type II secretory pathway component GspD/PulD (secretin)
MNPFRPLLPRTWCLGLLTLLAAQGLVPGPAAAQQPKPAAAAAEKVEAQIFRLKYIKASQAARILRELFGAEAGPKGNIALGVDERANSLVVRAGASRLLSVAAILQKIDIAGSTADRRPELRVYPLNHIVPDQALDEALRLVFAGGRQGKFVVDRRLRVVIASGDPMTLDAVEAALSRLESVARDRTAPAPAGLEVRLFWLVGAPARKGATGLPDDLKDLAADLGKRGIDRPSLATQVSVRTVSLARFETSGMVQLDVASDLSVSGTATDKRGSVDLVLTVTVNHAGSRRASSRRIASLRTQVSAPLGQPIVLGVTPSQTRPSAFVVQVARARAASPAAKKQAKAAEKTPAKRFTFSISEKPWGTVLAWLSDQTGLPVITTIKPTGMFTFVPPKPGRNYTIAEIIDILNEALHRQNYALVRGKRGLTLLALDERPDEALAWVLPNDLEQYGRSELVRMTVPLRTLQAEEVAPDVKKMLGPHGNVAALKKANQLILLDSAGNLRRIYQMLQELEKRPSK